MSNPFAGVRWIWKNGEMVEFEKATVHVMSHGLHYGSGVFEGIRCYGLPSGPAIFRLDAHIARLENSAKVYRMPLGFNADELMDACCEIVRANDFTACYIRPIAFRGFGPMGVNPLNSPVDVVVGAWVWGRYLGNSKDEGVDVCVSSWRRISADSMPAVAKATGNYLNAQLIKMEAVTNGYTEGLALDSRGFISEGSGENVFLVQNGVLITPPLGASVLAGVTRDSVIQIARGLGIEVREEQLPRGQLYTCDELFMTGTAAEITPIKSVDRVAVGRNPCPGEITHRIMDEFYGIIGGTVEDRRGWMHPVHADVPVSS